MHKLEERPAAAAAAERPAARAAGPTHASAQQEADGDHGDHQHDPDRSTRGSVQKHGSEVICPPCEAAVIAAAGRPGGRRDATMHGREQNDDVSRASTCARLTTDTTPRTSRVSASVAGQRGTGRSGS